MTKQELIAHISEKSGIEKVDVKTVVEGVFSTITKSVISRTAVTIRGFGTFGVKHRAEKPVRNITAKTSFVAPAHDVPFFKVSPEFKDALK